MIDFLLAFVAQVPTATDAATIINPTPDLVGVIDAWALSTSAGIGTTLALIVNFLRGARFPNLFDRTVSIIIAAVLAGVLELALLLGDGLQLNDILVAVATLFGGLSPLTSAVGTETESEAS